MTLDLDANEIQFIYNVLAELPTKSGAYPLTVKIREQVELQQRSVETPPTDA